MILRRRILQNVKESSDACDGFAVFFPLTVDEQRFNSDRLRSFNIPYWVVANKEALSSWYAQLVQRIGEYMWSRLTPSDAQHVAVYWNKLVGDFGSAGLWEFDGTSWTKVTPSDVDNTGNCMVAVDFP